MDELRVGVIGAGPWAHRVHAPGLQAHRRTRLASVWARRTEAAEALAGEHGAEVAGSFDELLGSVDAVAFAVPPAVQAELAPLAARAGKHLILEKPLADDLSGAEAIVDAVTGSGVAALLMLTRRFDPGVQRWLADLPDLGSFQGATGRWLAGGLLAGDYAASEWRQQDDGALIDAGPHAIDLLDAALGDIEQVHFASRGADGLWQLVFGHEGGTTSTLTLSLRMPVQPSLVDFAVYGEHGCSPLTGRRAAALDCYAQLLDNLLVMIREKRVEHPCGVHRGLHLQRVIAAILKAR